MSVTPRSGGTTASGNQTVTIQAPSGAVTGDLLILVVSYSNGRMGTPPTGFTRLTTLTYSSPSGPNDSTLDVLYGYKDAASSWTVGLTGPSDMSAAMAAYGGAKASTPIQAYSTATNAPNTTTITVPSVTPTLGGSQAIACLVTAAGHTSGAADITPASGWTERADAFTTRYYSVEISDLAVATASATPMGTASTSIAGGNAAVVLAVGPSNTAPNAPSWVTPQNSTIPADQDAYIELAFSDPDPGDSMSASNWRRWALDANGNRVGAAVTTYQPTPSPRLLIPAGTLTSGTQYEFQADTLDSQGVEGPYSVSLFVTAASTPDQPTWVDPISGQTIGLSSYTGVISAPTVDASEWTLYADNAGAIDTATILQGPVTVSTGDVRRHTFAGLANNTPVWWSVRTQYQGIWSQPAQIRTPVVYTAPPAPVISSSVDPSTGSLLVSITNPASSGSEPATSYNYVEVDDGLGKGREGPPNGNLLPTNQPYRYMLPVSDRDYSGNLWVTAVGTNGVTATVAL